MNRLASLALLVCLALPAAVLAQPAVPTLISYHGRVVDSAGVLIGAGSPVNRTVTFRVYRHKSNSGADRLWSESQTVTIANGEFSVLLGTGTAVAGETNAAATLDLIFNSSSITGSSDRYLGVTVDDGTAAADTEITPRQQIVTSAFALRAKVAEGLSGAITGAQIAPATITGTQIASGTIGGTQITDRSIGGIDLEVGTVGATELQNSGVTSAKILDGTIGTDDLANGAVTGAKIANGTISSDKLNFTPGVTDNSVTNAKIAIGAVTADKLSSNFGYAQFPQGARADIGLNLNHAGIGGNTSTMKANGTDHTILQLQNSSGNAVWDVKTTGEMGVAGRATLYSGLTITAGSTSLGSTLSVSGATSLGSTLSVSGATTLASASTSGAFRVGTTSNTNALFTVGDVAAAVTIPLKVQSSFSPYGDSTSDYSNAGLSTPIVAGTAMTPTAVIKARAGDDALLFLQGSDGKAKFWFNANSTCFRGDGGNTFNTFSDARLKRNIHPLTGALDKLLQLRSVTFEYLHAPGNMETGFVAQEVEKIFPDWVQKGDDGMLSLSIRGFESRTVQALRELRAEKDDQLKQRDATIAVLEKNVAAMKSEAAETKARLAALEQVLAKFTASGSN